MPAPVLLLSKTDQWSQDAGKLMHHLFNDALIWEQGERTDPLPQACFLPEYRLIVSFLSPWIVPDEMLQKSKLSINFHPGPCEYPGIGCYNFALYEEAKTFGAVCHHMLPRVDSGKIIKEVLFPVQPEDTVETLKLRTMQAMSAMFGEIIPLVAAGKPLPASNRHWTRPAFTRRQLDALCEITPDMDETEKNRRIRATTYPGYPGPYLLIGKEKRYFPVPPGPAVA
jgi:methionyl-tRNA formyltransferase